MSKSCMVRQEIHGTVRRKCQRIEKPQVYLHQVIPHSRIKFPLPTFQSIPNSSKFSPIILRVLSNTFTLRDNFWTETGVEPGETLELS